MKDKEEPLSGEKFYQKLSPKPCITTSCPEVLENELLRLLNKLEHRVEVLMAIAHNRRSSGCYESAEAYKKQAMESKEHAESIRKLLMGQT